MLCWKHWKTEICIKFERFQSFGYSQMKCFIVLWRPVVCLRLGCHLSLFVLQMWAGEIDFNVWPEDNSRWTRPFEIVSSNDWKINDLSTVPKEFQRRSLTFDCNFVLAWACLRKQINLDWHLANNFVVDVGWVWNYRKQISTLRTICWDRSTVK